MITDPNLHWWTVFALRLIAGIVLATAAILLLDLAAHANAPAASAPAPAATALIDAH